MPDRGPVRVLIVDDEPPGRDRVEELVKEQPDAVVAGVAADGNEAVEAIRELRPDLVLLDIQMPGMSGLEVVQAIGAESMPRTIFVTAHDEYAVRAFELSAVDYLLKPFSDERFEEAFERARRRIELEDLESFQERLSLLTDVEAGSGASAGRQGRYLDRIAVQGKGKMRIVPVREIDYIAADGVYCELHVGDRKHLVRTSLQSLEERLDPDEFFRIHRSHIVRLERVELLLRGSGGDCEVQLEGGVRLRVGRSRREELERVLGRI